MLCSMTLWLLSISSRNITLMYEALIWSKLLYLRRKWNISGPPCLKFGISMDHWGPSEIELWSSGNQIVDVLKLNYGCPEIKLKRSWNGMGGSAMKWEVLKSNCENLEIILWRSWNISGYPDIELWRSRNISGGLQWFMDNLNSNYGGPKIFHDILKYNNFD